MARNKTFYLIALIILATTALTIGAQSAGDTSSKAPAASPQATQTPAPQATQSPKPGTVYETASVLKATTRLVVVDVVATDNHGKAVTNLEKSNFKIVEDGVEQDIKVFSFQHPAVRSATEPALDSTNLPPNVFTNVPRYNSNNSLNVVLLDALNTTLPHQAYMRDEMIRFLEKLPEGQPVAIYTLSSKLTLLQDFTSDPKVLKEAVRKFKGKSSAQLENPAGGPEQELLPPGFADMMPAQALQSLMQFDAERTSFQTDIRVKTTLAAISGIARSLSGYPGRKNLIWISEAFPINVDPNLELTGDVFAGTRNYGPELAAAADSLLDAQIAIYPVDARGLPTPSYFQASNSGRDRFGRSMGRDPQRVATALSQDSSQLQAAHATMQEMADRTGGKAFYNRNDLDGAIKSGIEDGSTYYTLAYYPSNKNWNGKFRKIHVSLDQPNIKVRHRLGYYAVDPTVYVEQNKRQQASLFGEALSPDSPVSTGLKFQAKVMPPSEETKNKVLVSFGVDPQAISFENQNDGLHHAMVDCVVQAYTARGKYIKTEASTVNASFKPETFRRVMQTGFPCQQSIELPAGNYLLRLGVRDDRTGLMGTANAQVTVAAGSTETPSGLKKQ